MNSVEIPCSPLTLDSQNLTTISSLELPKFESDATQIKCRGLGLHQININEKNEFTVDASLAGISWYNYT